MKMGENTWLIHACSLLLLMLSGWLIVLSLRLQDEIKAKLFQRDKLARERAWTLRQEQQTIAQQQQVDTALGKSLRQWIAKENTVAVKDMDDWNNHNLSIGPVNASLSHYNGGLGQ